MKKFIKSTLVWVAMAMLTACGGGGSSFPVVTPPPATAHTATLRLTTTGTPSAQLGGVEVTLVLPIGVTPPLNSDGTVAASVATVSGVAASGRVLTAVYTPASGATRGTLTLVLASGTVSGFGAGEFATITLLVAPGSNPPISEFAVSAFAAIDVMGNRVTGLTAAPSSLVIQ